MPITLTLMTFALSLGKVLCRRKADTAITMAVLFFAVSVHRSSLQHLAIQMQKQVRHSGMRVRSFGLHITHSSWFMVFHSCALIMPACLALCANKRLEAMWASMRSEFSRCEPLLSLY